MILQRTGIIVGVWCHSIFKGVQIVIDPLHCLQQTMRLTATKNILYFRLFLSSVFLWLFGLFAPPGHIATLFLVRALYPEPRAGNSLIWFPSESLVFCPKMSDLLTSLISSERPEQVTHGRSFLLSEMGDSLTSLIWFEQNERFIHIAHQKRGNEQKWAIWSFFQKKFFFYCI